jgi:hypothetical protein
LFLAFYFLYLCPPAPGRGTSDTPKAALCSPLSRLQHGCRSDPAARPHASPQSPLPILRRQWPGQGYNDRRQPFGRIWIVPPTASRPNPNSERRLNTEDGSHAWEFRASGFGLCAHGLVVLCTPKERGEPALREAICQTVGVRAGMLDSGVAFQSTLRPCAACLTGELVRDSLYWGSCCCS